MRLRRPHGILIRESQVFRALDVLSLYMCIYGAGRMQVPAIFGAVMYMAGFTAENGIRLMAHRQAWQGRRIIDRLLPAGPLALAAGVAGLSLHVTLAHHIRGLFVAGLSLLLVLRSTLTHSVIQVHGGSGGSLRSTAARMAAVQALFAAAVPLVCFFAVDTAFAVRMGLLCLPYPAAVFLWMARFHREPLVQQVDYRAAEVSSYRIYYSLLLCSNIALYLSVSSYAGMLVLMPSEKGLFLPAALWVGLLFTGTVILSRLLAHRMKNAEKSTLFMAGGALWVFAQTQLSESIAFWEPSMAWLWSLLQAAGLALMLLVAAGMQEDLRLVLALTDDVTEASVKTYRSLIQQVSFVVAGALITTGLYVMGLGMEGRLAVPMSRVMSVYHFLPLCFVLLSLFFALLQPVNRDFLRKLRLYRDQKLTKTIIPAFERRLQAILVKRYRRRVGIKILSALIKPWVWHRVIGAKTVPQSEGPVIFVANHREIYGPIVVNLYLPFSFRPWIEHNMLDRDKIREYLWENTFAPMKPRWLARALMNLVLAPAAWALNSTEPIPVYRDTTAETVRTMKLSVAALEEQDNLLIFPENPALAEDGHYAQKGVAPFYSGFVHVARLYYRKTRKLITFIPVYANPRRRTITFGQGVRYDPRQPDDAEAVCAALTEQMNRLAR